MASDLRDLNGDTKLLTARMVGCTKSKKCSMEQVSARIGQTNPVARNKVFTLFGEGGADIGPPTGLIPDKTIRKITH